MSNLTLTRDLCGLDLFQRTEDGYFNVGLLFRAYNDKNGTDKRFDNFIKYQKDLMNEIYEDEADLRNLHKEDSEIITSEKQIYRYCVKAARGIHSDGSIWCHPILFIKAAMYLDPHFEYEVLKMVKDQLIDVRDANAKDRIALNESIKNHFENDHHGHIYSNVARLLKNCIGDVNDAKKQMIESRMLDKLKTLIDYGVIVDYDGIKRVVAKEIR